MSQLEPENIELTEKQPLKDENHNKPLEDGESTKNTNRIFKFAMLLVSISVIALVAFLIYRNSNEVTSRIDSKPIDGVTSKHVSNVDCNLDSILSKYASASLRLFDQEITRNTTSVNSFTKLKKISTKFDDDDGDYSYKSMFLSDHKGGLVEMFIKAQAVNISLEIMYGRMTAYGLIGSEAIKLSKRILRGGEFKKISTERTMNMTSKFDYNEKEVVQFCSFGMSNNQQDTPLKICYASQMGFCVLMAQNERNIDIVISRIIRVNSDEKQLAERYETEVRRFDDILLDLTLEDDTAKELPTKTTGFDANVSYDEMMEELNSCIPKIENPTKQYCFRSEQFKPHPKVAHMEMRNPAVNLIDGEGEEYQDFDLHVINEIDNDDFDEWDYDY